MRKKKVKRGAIERFRTETETTEELVDALERYISLPQIEVLQLQADRIYECLLAEGVDIRPDTMLSNVPESTESPLAHLMLVYNRTLMAMTMWDLQNYDEFGTLMYELGQLSVEMRTFEFVVPLQTHRRWRESIRDTRQDEYQDRDSRILREAERLKRSGLKKRSDIIRALLSHGRDDWPTSERQFRRILKDFRT